jgi:uncharacterized protein (DUF2336 family)
MNRRIDEELPALFNLAHDKSEAGRIALAGRLADLFLGEPAALTPEEETQVGALIEEILANNNYIVRRELAKHLATAARMPRKLALSFCREPIELAAPVLTACEQLSDGDLITVVETQSRDHARAVATRRRINEAVADALVTTGDIEILQIVAENLGAQLSPNALAALTEAACTTRTLQGPMIARPELTIVQATRLYWWLEKDLRRAALARFTIGTGQLDLALAKTIEEKLNEHILERFNDDAMLYVAAWLEERGAITVKILPQILRLGHFGLFNVVMGRLAGLEPRLIKAIVESHGGRPIAAVCRAIEIEKTLFVSIFLLSRGARPDEHIVHPRELSEALAAFDRLSPQEARDILNTWRQNPAYLLGGEEPAYTQEAFAQMEA